MIYRVKLTAFDRMQSTGSEFMIQGHHELVWEDKVGTRVELAANDLKLLPGLHRHVKITGRNAQNLENVQKTTYQGHQRLPVSRLII